MDELLNGVNVWRLPEDGPLLGSGQSALDLIGESYGRGLDAVVVPVARLDSEFFRLASGLAGEFIQKLQNYGLRLAVVGDISGLTAKSAPLRDFVRETNRRGYHLFVAYETELQQRLEPA